MSRVRILAILLISIMATSLAPTSMAGHAQDDKADKKDKKDKKEKKAKADGADGRELKPVLWSEPTSIESLDLFNGPGGAEGAPDPSARYTFVSRSASGTSEKINVVDDKQREWQIKFGAEARPSPTSSRIVWAAGYHVDPDYFVRRTHIEGRGGFDVWDVRFKRRDDGYKEEGLWSWESNPFKGTRELQGLKVLMALLSNWDIKTENNKIIRAKKKSGGDRDELIYYVSDWGATLGKTGSPFRKIPGFANVPAGSKGDAQDYASQAFIRGVSNGVVIFNYKGKDPKVLEGVSVEHARWMGEILGRLSDKQISDAVRAGGFTEEENQTYTRAIRGRINQLKNLK